MTSHHAVHLPTPYQEQPGMGPVTLRDGTRALVQISTPEDLEAVKIFYQNLSPAARESRFMGGQIPNDKELKAALNSSDRSDQCSLIVTRSVEDRVEVTSIGSYQRIGDAKAEFAVTVMDNWRNKGLGTLLLERLANLARRQGISEFEAYTTPFNRSM